MLRTSRQQNDNAAVCHCEPAKQSRFSGLASTETRDRHVPRDNKIATRDHHVPRDDIISLAEKVKDDMRDRFVPRDDKALLAMTEYR